MANGASPVIRFFHSPKAVWQLNLRWKFRSKTQAFSAIRHLKNHTKFNTIPQMTIPQQNQNINTVKNETSIRCSLKHSWTEDHKHHRPTAGELNIGSRVQNSANS
jgi:hypothetical protein